MTMRTLAVVGQLAAGCWLGASCATGGGDPDCGNGICSASENSTTCPEDCPAGSCGNGVCEVIETTETCSIDCYCGNATCDSGEDNTSCLTDCTTYCGDGLCNGDESASTCPADCGSASCGDGSCDAGEDALSCPADCSQSCTDPVCDLYPQCGCNTSQKCSLSGSARACVGAGTTAAGGTCTADADCAVGTLCLARDQAGSVGQCLSFCDPVNQNGCTGLTSYCIGLVDGNQITIPGAGVCSLTCQPQNPASGCPAGWSCEIYTDSNTQTSFTDCHADVGSGTFGTICDPAAGPFCDVGYGCFNDGSPSSCYQWCVSGSSCAYGACDLAAFEVPISVGGITYGVCR